jgi:hypothetical protein
VQKATVDPFKDSEMDLEEAMLRSQRRLAFFVAILGGFFSETNIAFWMDFI